ncbi:helix-turn-helix domain-containing protein, partial [Enterococcus faecalis]|nr:helix-turn-helix domain-containing protein [Enterococcus faecalis]
YIEKDIIKKIEIINTLWESSGVPKKKLAKDLALSIVTVRNYIQVLNEKFDNLIEEENQIGYVICGKHKKNKQDYLKELYKDSVFINACHYFLQTNFMQVELFARERYISFSKAYELRNEVVEYIQLLGIEPRDNLLPNNECKLRFLITYFQKIIGLEFVVITDADTYRLNQLFQAVEESEKYFFQNIQKSMHRFYFNCILNVIYVIRLCFLDIQKSI